MKLVHTTKYNMSHDDGAWGSSCLFIYILEDENEHEEVWDAYNNPQKREEIMHDLGYYSEYGVPAGAQYSRYTLHIMDDFVVVEERTQYNI